MLYQNVCVEGMGHAIPDQVVTSAWLEEQAGPAFRAAGAEFGLIEKYVGVKERRWWPEGVDFSDAAAMAARNCLEKTGIDKSEIQMLINTSVCREYWEPAMASTIHYKLGLSPSCRFFDVGNACVAFMDAMTIIADMIELGQIDTGMVVAGEGSREVTLSSIEMLRTELPEKKKFNENLVSLSFGSGAVAIILRHKSKSTNSRRLVGGYSHTASEHWDLCLGDRSWCTLRGRELVVAGVELLVPTWEGFKKETAWDDGMIDRYFSHQFSKVGQDLGWQRLGIDPTGRELRTLEWLGNIGAVGAPLCMALAIEQGFVQPGHKICLIGIGSGMSSAFLGMEW